MDKSQQHPHSLPRSSWIFQDISNFRTPTRKAPVLNTNSQFQSPNPEFVTASKQTPVSLSSVRRPHHRPGRSLSKVSAASRRLKAFEIEQSKSSRKAYMKKEKSLRTLAKSLTTWLNFLFVNPSSCGCNVFKEDTQGLVGFDISWRCPKRRKSENWEETGGGRGLGGGNGSFSGLSGSTRFGKLKCSLKEVCTLEDLEERMRGYLSLGVCEEVFQVMMQITKSIDERRLKMKAHCPIVTDFGMKEKAVQVLLSYNPVWLRIGLYIVQGGDSLLPNGDVNSDQENAFLKLLIEKQFLTHVGLAKSHAYNKNVEGLYRPGYYETLGSVILKRFLLLVLILDRMKSQSSLPLKYGIDGLDGGSPLLFSMQSGIKSSPQLVDFSLSVSHIEFLTCDVMHGEGNVLAHLVILGFKVSYHQLPLVEYDFSLSDVLEDLRDGVRLCRAIQLLKQESSILTKLLIPADTQKKCLVNCGMAVHYLKQFTVPLEDEDGVTITANDVACGDNELTISLLWNMFVHLQLPLLVDKAVLTEEIYRINVSSLEKVTLTNITPLEILLSWIQSICHCYNLKVVNLQSLTDGKALWCLLDYYFRKELRCSCPSKDGNKMRSEESIVSTTEYTDAVHNFVLSQKLTSLLGDFPEVLQLGDILENHGVCDGRCVAILLVFFAFHLIMKKNMRRNLSQQRARMPSKSVTMTRKEEVDWCGNGEVASKFKAIQAWWQSMADQSFNNLKKPNNLTVDIVSACQPYDERQRENAATVIQSHYRRLVARRQFLKIINAVILLQNITQAWLIVRHKKLLPRSFPPKVEEFSCGRNRGLEMSGRYIMFLSDRHNFIKMKSSALLIQQTIRSWIAQKRQIEDIRCHAMPTHLDCDATAQQCLAGCPARSLDLHKEISFVVKQEIAATQIQLAWRKHYHRNIQHLSATRLKCCLRGWLSRKEYDKQKQAALIMQRNFRHYRAWKSLEQARVISNSAIVIQSHARGWISRRFYGRFQYFIVQIQSCCRGCLIRRRFLSLREVAITIQSIIRGQITRKRLINARLLSSNTTFCSPNIHDPTDHFWNYDSEIILSSVVRIQRWWRSIMLLRLRVKSAKLIQSYACGFISRRRASKERLCVVSSVLRLQRCWKNILSQRLRVKSAITIQSYARGLIARKKAARERHRVVLIQSYWKGYIARKESRDQVQDARLRVQKAAANVDDSMRIINRLRAALSELLNTRSVSSILHTCATLDMATRHSQKCCEKLVEAGAIGKLLKLIRSMTRSIPDHEVLKHALSTLRNLARFPKLVDDLVSTSGSMETVFWQLLRNKEDTFFIACEILKKMCSTDRGAEAIHKSSALLKRMHALVGELSRRPHHDRNNSRAAPAKENAERRLKEAVELLKLMSQ